MKTFNALLLLTLPFIALSQPYYAILSGNEIYQVDTDYSANWITEVWDLPASMTDIAIAPDGTLYGVTQDLIVRIDLSDGSYEEVFLVPPAGVSSTFITSLTCTSDYELIFIENTYRRLLKYDLNEGTLEELFSDPQLWTPGDVTLYRGNVLFQNGLHLKAYNLANQTITNAFCIPSGPGNLYGIATDFYSCSGGQVIGSNTNFEFFDFDFDTGDVTGTTTDEFYTSPYGLASVNEYRYTDCNYEFEDNTCINSTANASQLEETYSVFPNPFQQYVYFSEVMDIQELEIFNVTGASVFRQQNPPSPLNLAWLNDGWYILKIYTSEGVINQTLIKK